MNMMAESKQPDPARFLPVAGAVLLLARKAEVQANYKVGQLFDRIWPSLMRGHYCLYTEASGRPVGFCNWMLVSREVLDGYLEDSRAIKPEDWDSGDIPFFPEMIAPEGHMRRIAVDLRDYMLSTKYPLAYALRSVVIDKDCPSSYKLEQLAA
jgi:cytolysin-activating lysine-acyltransferase